MDMAQMLQLGAKIFSQSNLSGNTGSNLDMSSLISAIAGLTGGGSNNFDVDSLLKNLSGSGMGDIAGSWLGDGDNADISPDQIASALGSDKIDAFASQLGLSTDEAAGGLSEAIPQMVDKASSGGALLDSIGGISGAIGLASKLFGR